MTTRLAAMLFKIFSIKIDEVDEDYLFVNVSFGKYYLFIFSLIIIPIVLAILNLSMIVFLPDLL